MKFTSEKEGSDSLPPSTLPFIGVLFERQPDIGFHTKVHGKKTFSGDMTKWDSFVPKSYTYNAISSMVHRATTICSTYRVLHEEFDFIPARSTKNGYPSAFVQSVIRRQLDLLYMTHQFVGLLSVA